MTRQLVPLFAFLLLAMSIGSDSWSADPKQAGQVQPPGEDTFAVAKVQSVQAPQLNQELLSRTGMVSKNQRVQLEIQEGPLKGKSVTVDNQMGDNPAYNVNPAPGDEVIVAITENGTPNGQPEINIADFHRVPPLAVLFAIFMAVYLFFGGTKGLKSLIGLGVAIALVASFSCRAVCAASTRF